MSLKEIAILLSLTALAGCEAFHVKTAEEIKQESRLQTIQTMRDRGMGEAEIKKVMEYVDMPYSKQLETSIDPARSSEYNLVALMKHSHQSCEFKRSMIKAPAFSSYDISKRVREATRCAMDSQRIVTNYYIGNSFESSSNSKDNGLLSNLYISWQSYMDALSAEASAALTDEMSIKFKSELRQYK